MTRNDDRQWVGAASVANSAGAAGQQFGNCTIGTSFTGRNRDQSLPHAALKRRAPQFNREIKAVSGILKIVTQLGNHLFGK